MMNSKMSFRVWATGLIVLTVFGLLVLAAAAQDGSEGAAPSCGDNQVAALLLEKASDRSSVTIGDSLIYTISIVNPRSEPDTVTRITDVLPGGFSFEEMLDAGDVYTPPTEDGDTLIWDEQIVVPAGETRKLVYRVRAWELGTFDNSVLADTIAGCLLGPKTTTVTVSLKRTYLPMVIRWSSTLPFSDNFDAGLSPNWVVFENFPGLSSDDWYWTFVPSLSGLYAYEPDSWDGFALSMYLGPGSQEWTNYQAVSNFRPFKDKLAGLWIRGTYAARTDNQGGQVGGYYVHIKPQDNRVYLWRIRPQTLQYHVADVVAQGTYSADISTRKWYSLKVEARGANIKVWLKEQGQPEPSYVLLINWTDANQTFMKGTVGFSVWRTTAYFTDITVTPLYSSSQ